MNNQFPVAKVSMEDLNLLVGNLMSQMGIDDPNELIRLIKTNEWSMTKQMSGYKEKNNIIYFTVKSDGTSGKDWITRLQRKGYYIGEYARLLLYSLRFIPTNGVSTRVAVIKGVNFADNTRTTLNIRAEARRLQLGIPNMEIACLIREKFTNTEIQDMGLSYIITMHPSFIDCDDDEFLLGASKDGNLGVFYGSLEKVWLNNHYNKYGFAFTSNQ